MSDRIENKELGISLRFIKHWTPEPLDIELARDAAMFRWLQDMARSQFVALLNMPGAE